MPSNFFDYFPKTYYNHNKGGEIDVVTNITSNFTFIDDIFNNSSVYYLYDIQEGDTPEIISYKVYGDSGFHWIIMRGNGIIDYKRDWPLDYKSLIDNIEENYIQFAVGEQTGLQWAISNYHSYYRKETRTIVGSDIIDTEIFQIDANTYASLSEDIVEYPIPDGKTLSIQTQKTRKTYYEYEIELNESKRNIKILKPEFIYTLKEEFVRVMSNA